MSVVEVFPDLVDARVDDYLFFINLDNITDLRDLLQEGETEIQYINNLQKDKIVEVVNEKKGENNNNNIKVDSEKNSKFNKNEMAFLDKLYDNAKARGLYYDQRDLYNFHVSGKSQLALLYGETLGLSFDSDLKLIPISPSYSEPNDILGFLNPTTGVYYESDTQLVQILMNAEENPDKLYMVIFDEMNLSQVEHWFSPFISKLEHERSITLFNERAYAINHNYKASVNINNNIIFVGTVNFDETTKHFSNRLLDRANVISPSKLSFIDIAKRNDEVSDDEIDPFYITSAVFRNEWVNNKQTKLSVLETEELEILDELHNLINQVDTQKGVSFRIAKSIARYLDNIPVREDGTLLIPRGEAFDLQIKQRILTKISGLETTIGSLVGNYHSEDNYQPGSIAELLLNGKYEHYSIFSESMKTLKSKAKELMLN
jgi:hypothetical protein